MPKPKAKQHLSPLKTKLLIGVVGFLLSITLHELLHFTLHWHQITGIQFFPNFYTIAQLVIEIPESYDLASEEFIAYSISAVVLLATAAVIAWVHDSSDKRTSAQILFPERFRKVVPLVRQKNKKSTSKK